MTPEWKKILVSPFSTIEEVLEVIDKGCVQFAIVVDEQQYLLGTITDGDIRRALIAKLPLNSPVSDVMYRTPRVAEINTPRDQLLAIMDRYELSAIPLLDKGRVAGLETLHRIIHKTKYDNPVFIMAGGFGTRLRPLTDNCPKPLLEVGGRPILETVLISFIKAGFQNFYISTHYLPEMIRDYFKDGEKWGVSIKYVHESTPLGTGGALGLLPKDLPELPIFLINGDVLTKINFEEVLAYHNKNKASATMCVREYEYQVPFGVIKSENAKIKSMVEKPIYRFHVNAGIYVIGTEIVKSVGENEVVDMPTLLERFLDDNVFVYPFHEYWLDIGRMDDFERAQCDIKTLGLL